MKRWSLVFTLLLAIAIAVGCSPQRPAQPTEEAAPQEAVQSKPAPQPEPAAQPESLPSSETAAASEATLEQKPTAKSVLPPDHWLVGTSDVKDMVPATIAPPAPRKLIAEHGPAYLEQIGSTRVLHLKGSHYDMGVQHGTLMKDEVIAAATLVNTVGKIAWKEKDYETSIREAWERANPFIPEKIKDEIRGVADATGLTVEQVQEFTIFPELFHCSGFAFWGKATADGELLHGRVLDYMREVGLDKFALLLIQEPEGSNAFVNVGYSGMLGSVTGMNVQQVAVGEMGGKGAEKWDGLPMSLLIREVLESAGTLDEAKAIMEKSPRTCQYYYVISDAKADNGRGSAVGVAAETDSIQFIAPNESHPQLARPVEDAVLMSAGSRYTCLVDRTEKMYGKITPEIALDLMARGVSMNSNMHDALFKPKTLELWVTHSTVEQPACNLPYTYYNLKELMAAKPVQ